jgi:hypothetical protein
VAPNPVISAPVIAVAISVAEGIERATAAAMSMDVSCLGGGLVGNSEVPILVHSKKLNGSARESKNR